MRWIGLFNLLYGALGMASAIYLARWDGIALCAWVMAVGLLLRSRFGSRIRSLAVGITRMRFRA